MTTHALVTPMLDYCNVLFKIPLQDDMEATINPKGCSQSVVQGPKDRLYNAHIAGITLTLCPNLNYWF